MGLFDSLTSKVGIEYTVEVEQAKAKVRELSGEQKKAAREHADALDKQSKAHDLMVNRLTIGIGIAVSAYAIGKNALATFEESSRLAAATAGVHLKALQVASGGLKTELELLQFASDGMNNKFHLTQAELEGVLVGMRAFVKEGKSQEMVSKAIGEAIRKGEVEPLKEAGIAFDESTAKVDKKRAVLDALAGATQRAGTSLEMAGDNSRRMAVRFEDATDKLQTGIGRVVESMAPLLESLAATANRIADIANAASKLPGGGMVGAASKAGTALSYVTPWGQAGHLRDAYLDVIGSGGPAYMAGERGTWGPYSEMGDVGNAADTPGGERGRAALQASFAQGLAGTNQWANGSRPDLAEFNPAAYTANQDREAGRLMLRFVVHKLEKTAIAALPELLGGRGSDEPVKGGGRKGLTAKERAAAWEALGLNNGTATGAATTGAWDGTPEMEALQGAYRSDMPEGYAAISAFGSSKGEFATGMDLHTAAEKRRKSLLASLFGTPEEISATSEALSVASATIDTFVGASQSAMDAWIKGGEGGWKAAKKFIASGLGAIAGDLIGKSTRHVIESVAHMALLDFPGAARHAGAAAIYGAGALTMGGLARAMSSDAHVPSGRGAGAGSAAAGLGSGNRTASGTGGGQTQNFFIGDTLGWQSERTNAIKFRAIERSARNHNPAPSWVGT